MNIKSNNISLNNKILKKVNIMTIFTFNYYKSIFYKNDIKLLNRKNIIKTFLKVR